MFTIHTGLQVEWIHRYLMSSIVHAFFVTLVLLNPLIYLFTCKFVSHCNTYIQKCQAISQPELPGNAPHVIVVDRKSFVVFEMRGDLPVHAIDV